MSEHTNSYQPKKKRGWIVAVLLVAVLVGLLVAGFILGWFDGLKPQTSTPTDTGTPAVEAQVLSIDDPLVEQLYGYVGHNNLMWTGPSTFYQDKLVTVEDISALHASRIIYNHFDPAQFTDAGTLSSEELVGCLDGLFDTAQDMTDAINEGTMVAPQLYPQDTVDALLHKIFGPTLPALTADKGMGEGFYPCRGGVVSAQYPGGGGFPAYDNSVLLKAEQLGNEIYLYDQYFRVSEDSTTVYGSFGNDKIGSTGITTEGDIWLGYADDVQRIIDQGAVPTYRHTFQQAEDGSYFWVSSEIVRD
ncbi:MAG: hypothetical protein FWG15_03225 [Propionibacteriaceae bacterium]|jgi:hypothetical protein|nr:hypothetical protein [Propionibacteriaceae bacterium]